LVFNTVDAFQAQNSLL